MENQSLFAPIELFVRVNLRKHDHEEAIKQEPSAVAQMGNWCESGETI
jgi:hypothetical protein